MRERHHRKEHREPWESFRPEGKKTEDLKEEGKEEELWS